DEARPRTGQRLVHGAGDDIRVGDRAGVQAGRDEPGEVGHIDPELGTDLVGDRPEGGEVELTRVGRPAGDDGRRPVLERLLAHRVHVHEEGRRVHAVGDRVVELAGEVELHAVGEVAAVGELQPQDGVSGGGDG